MANARGKHIDNTHLSIDMVETRGFIHRDYIAHCLRWTHVIKWLGQHSRWKKARVLDIGCGVDLPLARMLYSSRFIVDSYVGIDYNDEKRFNLSAFGTGKFPIKTYGRMVFPDNVELRPDEGVVSYAKEPQPWPNVVVCFEVLEHVEPDLARRMVFGIRDLLAQDSEAVAFISTPCYDASVGAAGNHVSEITYEAMGALLEDAGLAIEGHWGTFASQRDYKQTMLAKYPGIGLVWDKLSEYYDTNYLATIFAPLFPHLARNALWQVKAAKPGYRRAFPELAAVLTPWTSSEAWPKLNG